MLDAFLRAITDNPDDLVSRRALADWLMEQPEPALQERGEFVALQLSAGGFRGARRAQMEARQRELLARYQEEWARPVLATGAVERCVFRNGLIEGVVTDPVLLALAVDEHGLFRLAPVRELIFARADAGDLRCLTGYPLGQVRSLTLLPGSLRDGSLEALLALPCLTGLRRLVLDGNDVGQPGVALLAGWPGLAGLAELSLRRCDVTAAGARDLLESPLLDPGTLDVSLARLDLRDNRRFGCAEAAGLLAELEGRFSGRRLALARRLLGGVLTAGRPRDYRALVEGPPGRRLLPTLLGGLSHCDGAVRALTASRLAQVNAGPEVVPALVRRFFEPGLAKTVRAALERQLVALPAGARSLVQQLLRSDDPETSLLSALRRVPLPAPVRAAFLALCGRRMAWRAGHGRAAAAPLPALPAELREQAELLPVLAQVAELAEEAALRHLDPGRLPADGPTARALARDKEYAWLAGWLVRLWLAAEEEAALAS